MDDDGPAGWVMAIGFMLAGAGALWMTYATVLAFVGGVLWPLGIEFGGSIGFGLTWLLVGGPSTAMFLYWGFVVIVLPLALVDTGVRVVLRRVRGGGRG